MDQQLKHVVQTTVTSPVKRIRVIIPNRNRIGFAKLYRKSGLSQNAFSLRHRIHESQIQLWNTPEYFGKLLNSSRKNNLINKIYNYVTMKPFTKGKKFYTQNLTF